MKYCSDCGFENVDEAQFCRNCGARLKESEIIHPVDDAKTIVNDKPDESMIHPVDNARIIVNDKSDESIISKLFYKTDKYTGELRFAKTKSISIGVFVIFFLMGLIVGVGTESIFVVFIVAVLFGLIFAIPTFILGFVLGWIIDKITH